MKSDKKQRIFHKTSAFSEGRKDVLFLPKNETTSGAVPRRGQSIGVQWKADHVVTLSIEMYKNTHDVYLRTKQENTCDLK
ncbi:MAG TPA: hypothetical protein DDX51_02495 [Clostridiales bacterium]|nr:hypothetical protein [Clostridiales bacterium]